MDEEMLAFWRARLDEDDATAGIVAESVGYKPRALREVEADRAIMDMYAQTLALTQAPPPVRDGPYKGMIRTQDYLDAKRELAALKPVVTWRVAVHGNHPGYREEWKP